MLLFCFHVVVRYWVMVGGGYHDYEDHVKGGLKDCKDDACNNSATNVSCNGYE